jgi:hypothetical protein
MKSNNPTSSAALPGLTPLYKIEPLTLLTADDVRLALEQGGMYPPNASSRSGGAALQFREGVSFDDALITALNNIHGAQGLTLHMVSSDCDEMTRRTALGLAALLEVAGGAVALAHQALFRLEARATERGGK